MKNLLGFMALLLLVQLNSQAAVITNARTAPMKMCNSEAPETCFQDRSKANHGFIMAAKTSDNKVKKSKYVALLIHGLSDSPYFYRDIAQILFNKGINVVAIRTKGHGTHPSHLSRITRNDWYADTAYGVELAKRYGDNVIIGGMSNGGSLALREAQRNPRIKGLLLFSAALRTPKTYNVSCALVNPITKYPVKIIGGIFRDASDYQATKTYGVDVRYQGIHNNGTCELVKMNRENDKLAKAHSNINKRKRRNTRMFANLDMPIFNVVSEYDTVLDLDYMVKLSMNAASNKEEKSYLVLYRDPSRPVRTVLPKVTYARNVKCMNHASTLLKPSPEMGYTAKDYTEKCEYSDAEIAQFNNEQTYDFTPEVNFHFDLMEEALNNFIDKNYRD